MLLVFIWIFMGVFVGYLLAFPLSALGDIGIVIAFVISFFAPLVYCMVQIDAKLNRLLKQTELPEEISVEFQGGRNIQLRYPSMAEPYLLDDEEQRRRIEELFSRLKLTRVAAPSLSQQEEWGAEISWQDDSSENRRKVRFLSNGLVWWQDKFFKPSEELDVEGLWEMTQ